MNSDTELLLEGQKQISEDVRDVRKGVGAIEIALSEFKVSVEHRLTRVEQRASVFGAISGALTGLVSRFLWH